MPKSQKSWYEIQAKAKTTHADIYIYEEIGYWGISASQFAKDLKQLKDVSTITLHLNTPGGSVPDGTAIYNSLKKHSATVTVEIDGHALSMGSIIALSGDTVKMAENTLFMIHNPWGWAVGDAKDLRKQADVSDKHKEAMLNTYESKSNLSRDELSKMMDEETWFTASESLEAGFVDEVIDTVELVASANTKEFISGLGLKKIPELFSTSTLVDQKKEARMPDPRKPTPAIAEDKDATATAAAVAKATENAVQAALDKEKTRREDVSAVFSAFKQHDFHAELLEECKDDVNCTSAKAKDKLLIALGKGSSPTATDPVITVGATSKEKFAKAASAAIAVKAGLEVDAKESEFAGELRGYSMRELARKSLETNGVSTTGMDQRELVGAAFTHTSSDFPALLQTTAERSLLIGFNEVEDSFKKFTRKVSLSDFKKNSQAGLSQFGSLDKIKEGEGYKHGTFDEEVSESMQLATFGKLFGITRQAIINDDLNAFTGVPMKMGKAGKRTVADLAWGVLISHIMKDGQQLFHANHKNLIVNNELTIAGLGEAKKMMRGHKDTVTKQVLDIIPHLLLMGSQLEDQALTLMASETDPAQDNSKVPNIYRKRYDIVASARLDEAYEQGWVMTANPKTQDVIGVGYLDGKENPYLESKEGWNVDGVEFKVRIDATAAPLDFRTLVKSTVKAGA